jgi:hypothetical protein
MKNFAARAAKMGSIQFSETREGPNSNRSVFAQQETKQACSKEIWPAF